MKLVGFTRVQNYALHIPIKSNSYILFPSYHLIRDQIYLNLFNHFIWKRNKLNFAFIIILGRTDFVPKKYV